MGLGLGANLIAGRNAAAVQGYHRWPDAIHVTQVMPSVNNAEFAAPDDLELGARTQVWLAADDDPAANLTGRYLHHQRAQRVPEAVDRAADQEALIVYCADLTGQPLD